MANLAVVADLVRRAKDAGAVLACFPENFNFMGSGPAASLAQAEALDAEGGWVARYGAVARRHAMWLSLGGFQEAAPPAADGSPRLYNTHVVISSEGRVVQAYRKLHLFDVELPSVVLKESSFTSPGDAVALADSPVGRLGLSTCYDLRFPELYTTLRAQGARVLLVPSAFTVKTGSAHWEVLLRARAIETQCYVVAAAQTGQHNEKRSTYGHAMIIDPWGTVVAQCSDGVGPTFAVADVDADLIDTLRSNMPVAAHRRDPAVLRSVSIATEASESGGASGAGAAAIGNAEDTPDK